ncbi:hypothetical protein GCM10010988_36480 [Cnuibacter physcomitrellae]|nr:hypothetical protein GCM10010988_36480 [Cnuibacter physcomitrellae]
MSIPPSFEEPRRTSWHQQRRRTVARRCPKTVVDYVSQAPPPQLNGATRTVPGDRIGEVQAPVDSAPRRVVRAGSPEEAALARAGWIVVARSWAAELNAGAVGRQPLIDRMSRVADAVVLRELLARDATAVLALDARTLGDYPGDVATAHAPLKAEGATPSPTRRGWGAFDERGSLVGPRSSWSSRTWSRRTSPWSTPRGAGEGSGPR